MTLSIARASQKTVSSFLSRAQGQQGRPVPRMKIRLWNNFSSRNSSSINVEGGGGGTVAPASDPSQLVHGLTPEQIQANPDIAAFLQANFGAELEGESGGGDDADKDDGFSIPVDVLKEYGYDPKNFIAPAEMTPSYGAPKIDRGLGSPEQQALNIRTLHTYLRKASKQEEKGTNACRNLRYHHRMIPGVLYGSVPNSAIFSVDAKSQWHLKTPWSELQRELDRFHRRFESRVYDLTIYENEEDTEGTVHRVVPRDVQRHPVQGSVYCTNFLRYHSLRPLKLPIVYINQEESPALKRDGFIVPVNKYIECLVEDGAPIPEALELECTGVQVKDVLRIDRIIFPDGVRPTKRVDVKNFVIGPVQGGRGGAASDSFGDDEGAASAEGDEAAS